MIRTSSFWTACVAGLVLVCASVLAVFAADDKRGDEAEPGEKKVSLDSLPEVVRQAILKEAGNGKIEDIAEMSRNGQTFYEFDVVADGRETEIHIGTDGKLLGKKDEGAARGKLAAKARQHRVEFTNTFGLEKCTFATTGRNAYFILEPGYQLTLEHKDGDETEQLVITVLNETEKVGGIETRVVEERESENGELKEVSRNYFAFCNENRGIFYFGEQTTKYKNGQPGIANDSWRADSADCKPGLAMPGLVLVGSRYYQEWDPKAAMDRAEIVALDETLETPAGTFEHCLKVQESNPLEGDEEEFKLYAPGIGLIQDEDLLLTKFGTITL
ncbi:MAG: hypothetical protein HUU46_15245 [Candidatus Hydrogenedentes bacterium]|nr:hypothetical protein [Candidatus Hydrogenedentota bacterium]